MQVRAAFVSHLPEGEGENSPGWSPLERTEPWEAGPKETAPSRRAGRNSAPHVAWIVFNAVLLEKGDVLSLKVSCAMMLFLTRDVRQRSAHLCPSDGKRTIAFLPFKAFDLAGLVHPGRGCTLDLSHCRSHWHRRRQREQKVNMVLHSADTKRLELVFTRDAAHISPQTRLDFRENRLAPLFGGKNTMYERATIGV